MSIPYVGIVAFFTEACPYGGAFLLDNGSFVGDGFCGAHIADELFDYKPNCQSVTCL
jgi:hypothetical protein